MMRQFELVERIKAYDPNVDEDLLNRAYVYSMRAHGSQLRASGDPCSPPGRGRRHPRANEARRRLDRDRVAARHGRRHGCHPRRHRAAVWRRDRAARRRRDQAVAPRTAIRPDPAGRKFPQARPRHVRGHSRPFGQAGGPPAQHADPALYRERRKARPDRPRDDGDLCAARRADRHAPDEGSARRPRLCRALPEARAGVLARLEFLRDKGAAMVPRIEAELAHKLAEGGIADAAVWAAKSRPVRSGTRCSARASLRAALGRDGVSHPGAR